MRTVMPISRAMEALFKLGPGRACWHLKTWTCVLYQRDYSRWVFFLISLSFYYILVYVSPFPPCESWGLARWQAPLPTGPSHLIVGMIFNPKAKKDVWEALGPAW